ncbi:MAG TPA: hypothetical protein PKD37_02670 [Oligoflexia bacterium]|nr:hypothetical protein [Oligoflexia bacterium]HMP26873.1 hypothetical protein [Oligoflexia bacterium]
MNQPVSVVVSDSADRSHTKDRGYSPSLPIAIRLLNCLLTFNSPPNAPPIIELRFLPYPSVKEPSCTYLEKYQATPEAISLLQKLQNQTTNVKLQKSFFDSLLKCRRIHEEIVDSREKISVSEDQKPPTTTTNVFFIRYYVGSQPLDKLIQQNIRHVFESYTLDIKGNELPIAMVEFTSAPNQKVINLCCMRYDRKRYVNKQEISIDLNQAFDLAYDLCREISLEMLKSGSKKTNPEIEELYNKVDALPTGNEWQTCQQFIFIRINSEIPTIRILNMATGQRSDVSVPIRPEGAIDVFFEILRNVSMGGYEPKILTPDLFSNHKKLIRSFFELVEPELLPKYVKECYSWLNIYYEPIKTKEDIANFLSGNSLVRVVFPTQDLGDVKYIIFNLEKPAILTLENQIGISQKIDLEVDLASVEENERERIVIERIKKLVSLLKQQEEVRENQLKKEKSLIQVELEKIIRSFHQRVLEKPFANAYYFLNIIFGDALQNDCNIALYRKLTTDFLGRVIVELTENDTIYYDESKKDETQIWSRTLSVVFTEHGLESGKIIEKNENILGVQKKTTYLVFDPNKTTGSLFNFSRQHFQHPIYSHAEYSDRIKHIINEWCRKTALQDNALIGQGNFYDTYVQLSRLYVASLFRKARDTFSYFFENIISFLPLGREKNLSASSNTDVAKFPK